MDVYRQGGAKKTNNDAKKNENEQEQICLTHCFVEQKQQARNEPKQASRKPITMQNKN